MLFLILPLALACHQELICLLVDFEWGWLSAAKSIGWMWPNMDDVCSLPPSRGVTGGSLVAALPAFCWCGAGWIPDESASECFCVCLCV